MTRPGRTCLISTKHTCSYYGTYLLFCMCYPQSVNFIEFLMDFCIYDDIWDTTLITDKKLLHFKLSKSDQIVHVGKTGFPRPGHIYASWKKSGHLINWTKFVSKLIYWFYKKTKGELIPLFLILLIPSTELKSLIPIPIPMHIDIW